MISRRASNKYIIQINVNHTIIIIMMYLQDYCPIRRLTIVWKNLRSVDSSANFYMNSLFSLLLCVISLKSLNIVLSHFVFGLPLFALYPVKHSLSLIAFQTGVLSSRRNKYVTNEIYPSPTNNFISPWCYSIYSVCIQYTSSFLITFR